MVQVKKSYTAKILPNHAGPAAWNVLLGAQPAPVPLVDNITADFVIIGAGFAGLSSARRLRQLQPSAKIVVLEAGQIAQGAAGRNSGFMIDLPHDLNSEDYSGGSMDKDRLIIRLNRAAIDFARGAVLDYDIKDDYFDEVGKINGATSARAHGHNIGYAGYLKGLDEPSEILDAAAMKDITGSDFYLSGLFTAGTVQLQPAGYIRGLAAGLAGRDGVQIFEQTPALNFAKDGETWAVKTPQGQVSTPRVIIATNGHLESFGVAKGRLIQVFLYASMTRELNAEDAGKLGGKTRWGITPSDPMGTTVRRIDSGQGGARIVTRTCATWLPSLRPSAREVTRAARVHQRKFDQRFPVLAGIEMQYSWAGHLCLSLNGVSVMGDLGDGVFSACVQNGLGTARGTLSGIGAAELACGTRSDISDYFTEQDPPSRLPPRLFNLVGGNAFLRWKEWRAKGD